MHVINLNVFVLKSFTMPISQGSIGWDYLCEGMSVCPSKLTDIQYFRRNKEKQQSAQFPL